MRFFRIVSLLVCLGWLGPVQAQIWQITFNTPNGNPTPPNNGYALFNPELPSAGFSRTSAWGTAFNQGPRAATWSMNPVSMDNTLMNNLAANGITDINNGGAWNIYGVFFSGTMTLTHYDAWAGTTQAVQQGQWNIPAQPAGDSGGAVIALHYDRGANDPPVDASGTHWLQLAYVSGTWPAGYTVVNGAALDNIFRRPGDTWPFYDAYSPDGTTVYGGPADNTDFVDEPAMPYGSGETRFELRLATWDPPTKTIYISNQLLMWGFYD